MPRPIHLSALFLAGGLAVPGAPAPAGENAVRDRHLAAFAAGDGGAIMADHTDGSVLITSEGALRGQQEIRPLRRHADGPVANTIWSAETPETVFAYATDSAYVEHGRILYLTFAADTRAKDEGER